VTQFSIPENLNLQIWVVFIALSFDVTRWSSRSLSDVYWTVHHCNSWRI